MTETQTPYGDTPESERPYVNASQQILLSIVEFLGERPFDPATVAQLTERSGANRDQVFRALHNLQLAGWAEQTASSWRLSPRVTQLSERVRLALADLHRVYLQKEDSNG